MCLCEQQFPVEVQTKCPKGARKSLQEANQLTPEIHCFFSHLRHYWGVALTVQKVHTSLMVKEKRKKQNIKIKRCQEIISDR